MPEVKGTVKAMNKKGTGLLLEEYQNWWNFGRDYSAECARSFRAGDAVTLTYEEVGRPDGSSSFFLLEVWPTSTGKPAPQPAAPSGPVPTNGPKPTAKPDSYDGYQAAATGPVPTPPSRENAILFQVCLKAAQEWVLATETKGAPNYSEGHVLYVADLYYVAGLKLILGEAEEPQDGDPGPEPSA